MNNRETLMELMLDHGLERREIAELVLVHRELADRWLLSHESSRAIDVPDMAIELLKLKLARSEPSVGDT